RADFFCFFFFFFSSRRRHTRWPRDWSSDVCSSDLYCGPAAAACAAAKARNFGGSRAPACFSRSAACWHTRMLGCPARFEAAWLEIGRASCRERVEIWGGAGGLNKKEEGLRVDVEDD